MFSPGSYKIYGEISIDEISIIDIYIVRIQIDVKSTKI